MAHEHWRLAPEAARERTFANRLSGQERSGAIHAYVSAPHPIAAELMRREPGFRLGEWERTRQPFRDPELKQTYVGNLAKAGLPW